MIKIENLKNYKNQNHGHTFSDRQFWHRMDKYTYTYTWVNALDKHTDIEYHKNNNNKQKLLNLVSLCLYNTSRMPECMKPP